MFGRNPNKAREMETQIRFQKIETQQFNKMKNKLIYNLSFSELDKSGRNILQELKGNFQRKLKQLFSFCCCPILNAPFCTIKNGSWPKLNFTKVEEKSGQCLVHWSILSSNLELIWNSWWWYIHLQNVTHSIDDSNFNSASSLIKTDLETIIIITPFGLVNDWYYNFSGMIHCRESIDVISYKIGVCRVSPSGKDCHTEFHRYYSAISRVLRN